MQKIKDLYQNKYRIKSTRLPGYDYSKNGYYFITICTKNREYFFGCIENEIVILSKIGKIINTFWKEISKKFKFVKLDEFVIMPNHIHGIVMINYDNNRGKNHFNCCIMRRDAINRISTDHKHNKRNEHHKHNIHNTHNTNIPINSSNLSSGNKQKGGITGKYNPMGKNTLGEIIRWFKGRCTFEINNKYPNLNFKWQSGFYDRIIRDNEELDRIREYIIDNPYKWDYDKDNLENINIRT